MFKKIFLFLFFINLASVFPSERGIYALLVKNSNLSLNNATVKIKTALESANFKILNVLDVATPNILRKENENKCNFKVKEILFTSSDYIKFLTSYGKRYLLSSILRISIFTNENGTQINIADPVTVNMIVFNDLWEAGKENLYNEIVKKTFEFRKRIVNAVHNLNLGENLDLAMPPLRSEEDLREASKDMFMLVGHLTFFTDEDQFPLIYSEKIKDPKNGIKNFLNFARSNLAKFQPQQEDFDYRYTKSPEVLKWRIVAGVFSEDSTALLLGITRPRTEGLSFKIAGSSRESDINNCPGIDHAPAYPIEVLAIAEHGKLKVFTAREMFRMDMWFWDAGMSAFMNHMSMPSLLDASLRRAILGNKYKE